jgi:phosphoenolpyruvate synthase/pyruvate phosphate dikinase
LCDDVFRLSLDELLAITAEPDDPTRHDLAALIARRKHEEWLEQRLTPPETLPMDDTAAQDSPQPESEGPNGIAASPGVASGRARIVTSIEEAAEIESTDVLVASAPSTAWTPFLAIAGGLVCESGCEFSPAAIAARTYGIPAIMACKCAMHAIKDGHRVTVDGSAGIVGT